MIEKFVQVLDSINAHLDMFMTGFATSSLFTFVFMSYGLYEAKKKLAKLKAENIEPKKIFDFDLKIENEKFWKQDLDNAGISIEEYANSLHVLATYPNFSKVKEAGGFITNVGDKTLQVYLIDKKKEEIVLH